MLRNKSVYFPLIAAFVLNYSGVIQWALQGSISEILYKFGSNKNGGFPKELSGEDIIGSQSTKTGGPSLEDTFNNINTDECIFSTPNLKSLQNNPNNVEYWKARGWTHRPADWHERTYGTSANIKNPNNIEYWKARGFDSVPLDWAERVGGMSLQNNKRNAKRNQRRKNKNKSCLGKLVSNVMSNSMPSMDNRHFKPSGKLNDVGPFSSILAYVGAIGFAYAVFNGMGFRRQENVLHDEVD